MQHKGALIAMSGGVDSSVAAWLTQQQGCRCYGATMRLYDNESIGQCGYHTCCSQQDIEDAAEVAFRLDILYEVLDYTEEFRREVMEKFVRVYAAGGTPNPCIDCNRTMKFSRLLAAARAKGLDCIVTGHYARIQYDPARGRWLLKKALDAAKDQSYVLYAMTQDQLAHTLLPLGTLHKTEVRVLAQQQGFCNARKHDSQDICFVPDGDYGAFLEQYTGRRLAPRPFIDPDGRVLGQHQGMARYTIGQRKGLGLALGRPAYVCAKDPARNTVTVGPEQALYTRGLVAEDVNWIAFDALPGPLRVTARTRYRQAEQPATVYPELGGRLRLEFDAPQRAIAPGQAVVLYSGDEVLGGGTIVQALP